MNIKKELKLFLEIQNNGKFIDGGWDNEYYVTKYMYNNKIYELWENMDLGIKSYVKEIGE